MAHQRFAVSLIWQYPSTDFGMYEVLQTMMIVLMFQLKKQPNISL